MSDVKALEDGASVQQLQAAMAAFPQLDLSAHTRHYFADGMYCRALFRPKDALIVGKVHLKSHFYIVVTGSVAVTSGDGSKAIVYMPGDVIVSSPGTKRAVYALEDSICLTVHRTDSQDLEEIERELVEPDENSLFGPGNIPKALQ